MEKKHQIIMLPSDRGRLPENGVVYITHDNVLINRSSENAKFIFKDCEYQHLYIISDEEIKEGDWFYIPNQMIGFEHICNKFKDKKTLDSIYTKKIIATTNPELTFFPEEDYHGRIKKMLPKFPTDFIEKYVKEWNKGNVIKEVMLEYDKFDWTENSGSGAKCMSEYQIKLNSNNTVIIHPIEEKEYTKEIVLNIFLEGIRKGHDDSTENIYLSRSMKNARKWFEENY